MGLSLRFWYAFHDWLISETSHETQDFGLAEFMAALHLLDFCSMVNLVGKRTSPMDSMSYSYNLQFETWYHTDICIYTLYNIISQQYQQESFLTLDESSSASVEQNLAPRKGKT